MFFNIVLVSPQIPQNTGNIARLAAATKSVLHLIEPIGFSLSDKYMKRAGLDYWEHLEIHRHLNFASFEKIANMERGFFLSSKVEKPYWENNYQKGDFLIFGSETKGIDQEIMEKYQKQSLTIPQYNDHVRCLNLANSVSIVLYEAIRQNRGLMNLGK